MTSQKIQKINPSTLMKLKKDKPSPQIREKLLSQRIENLNDAELLSILIGTGSQHQNVNILSNKLLTEFKSIHNLAKLSLQQLIQINGIGLSKASRIMAAFELGKRWITKPQKKTTTISSSNEVFNLVNYDLINRVQEYFYVISLDTKNSLLDKECVALGSGNICNIKAIDVFRTPIIKGALSIILIHNHPSGNLKPSMQDIKITETLSKLGHELGIHVIDHLIIGNNQFYSFADQSNILKQPL